MTGSSNPPWLRTSSATALCDDALAEIARRLPPDDLGSLAKAVGQARENKKQQEEAAAQASPRPSVAVVPFSPGSYAMAHRSLRRSTSSSRSVSK